MSEQRITDEQLRRWVYEGHRKTPAIGALGQSEMEVWRDRFLMVAKEMSIRGHISDAKLQDTMTALRAVIMKGFIYEREKIFFPTEEEMDIARRSYSMVNLDDPEAPCIRIRTDVPPRKKE